MAVQNNNEDQSKESSRKHRKTGDKNIINSILGRNETNTGPMYHREESDQEYIGTGIGSGTGAARMFDEAENVDSDEVEVNADSTRAASSKKAGVDLGMQNFPKVGFGSEHGSASNRGYGAFGMAFGTEGRGGGPGTGNNVGNGAGPNNTFKGQFNDLDPDFVINAGNSDSQNIKAKGSDGLRSVIQDLGDSDMEEDVDDNFFSERK